MIPPTRYCGGIVGIFDSLSVPTLRYGRICACGTWLDQFDFIAHIPGQQDGAANLAVVEVKACGALGNTPTKDADSLVAFLTYAGY